ncbi:MAG: hypothetical protein Ta2E_10490 [Mycoplasmoidaceae bacterium]|nr:MAG: hypothetical protein Ta2E_10490 [Mycoplasmoidaceae bacterium]
MVLPLQMKNWEFIAVSLEHFIKSYKLENGREFQVDTHRFSQSQLKGLLKRLFLGISNKSNLYNPWYIEYNVEGEQEPRYQVLSPMNQDKLETYITNYLEN